MIVRVEPSVTMGRLSHYLHERGYALLVVPELDTLSVGGLINGYGVETSSHKYGLVADTAISYEVVLSNGDVVVATADNDYKDLFFAIPWSYGALGFLVSVEFRIRKSEKYVKVQYYPTRTTEETTELFREATLRKAPPEFVEGLMYNKNEAVVMLGEYATEEEARAHPDRINDINLWYKPYFSDHAESLLNDYKARGKFSAASTMSLAAMSSDEDAPYVEYIPTVAYFHRHVKGIFWEMKLILPFGHHAWFLALFGWLLPASVPLVKATQPPSLTKFYEERHVAQDGLAPLDKLSKGIEFFHTNFECYPLWLCPHKLCYTEPQGFLRPSKEASKAGTVRPGGYEMYVDIGCYYSPGPVLRGEEYSVEQAHKNYEQWLIDNSGYQALYAITEMTREQWKTMFDTKLYDKCRTKYDASGWFMDAFDKVCRPKHSSLKKTE
jgi:Delta24-sterol reductase